MPTTVVGWEVSAGWPPAGTPAEHDPSGLPACQVPPLLLDAPELLDDAPELLDDAPELLDVLVPPEELDPAPPEELALDPPVPPELLDELEPSECVPLWPDGAELHAPSSVAAETNSPHALVVARIVLSSRRDRSPPPAGADRTGKCAAGADPSAHAGGGKRARD
jgi:hypothetical protein